MPPHRLLLFAVQLVLVTSLRTLSVARRHTRALDRWCTELGFGLLVALPLLY